MTTRGIQFESSARDEEVFSMKKFFVFSLLAFSTIGLLFGQTVDVYDFKMRVKVPRIYDNMTSNGSRK